VEADPHHPGTVVAATGNALLFRSRDNGDHWSALTFPAQLQATLHAFAIDPKTPDLYYAGLAGAWPEFSGLFSSSDEGVTWRKTPGLAGKEILSIAIFPSYSSVIAAGARDGVYLTRDAGQTWRRVSPIENRELQPIVSLAFDPNDSRVLYAGTPHLPWKSSDGGATWRSIHTGMLDDSDVFSIQADPERPSRVFASACSGLYQSVNGGLLWKKMAGAAGASYRTYFIRRDPRRANVVFGGTTRGLIRSDDGGLTWRRLSANTTRWVGFDAAHPGRIFVASDDAGLERSDDSGDTLREINDGFCNRHLPSLAAAGELLYTGTVYERTGGGVFRLTANAARWERMAPATRLSGEPFFQIAPASPEHLYAAGYSSVLVSSDEGRNWISRPGPPRARLTALLAAAAGPDIFAGADSGLFRSADEGRTWKPVPLPTAQASVRALLRMNDSRVLAITSGGAFLSSITGHWTSLAPPPGNAEIYQVVSTEEGALLAATSAGLARSEDAGKSWRLLAGALHGTVRAICKQPSAPGVLFAAGYGDLFESRDSGRSWAKVSPAGPMITAVKELVIVPGSPDRLFALTQNQGVFALELEPRASAASGSR
jgi:photosystem II stability/assembly factor-like uncharacterized protein